MTHQFNLNKPSHLVANDVIRQLEIIASGSGLQITFGTKSHDLIEGLIAQYQDLLLQESQQKPLAESISQQQQSEETAEAWLRSRLKVGRLPEVVDVYVAAKNYFYVTFYSNPTREQIMFAESALQLRIERTPPLHNRYSIVFQHPDQDEI